MNRHHVSKNDLHEDLRLAGSIDDLKKVKIARLERSGQISVQRQPQIFKMDVKTACKPFTRSLNETENFQNPSF